MSRQEKPLGGLQDPVGLEEELRFLCVPFVWSTAACGEQAWPEERACISALLGRRWEHGSGRAARLRREVPRPWWLAALLRGSSGSVGTPCLWTSRGSGGNPGFADHRLTPPRPTWRNLSESAAAPDAVLQKMHYYRYSNAEVSCWYKYLLFSYNIVFWLAGVAFLAAGLWAWSEKGVLSDLTKVTGLHGLDPVLLVLVVGIVMFTLGFAGCVGALRENICLLKFFCGAIVFIFLLEVAVAVLAFLFQDWVRDRVKEFFENNIKSYRDDIDLQNLIDSLQKINHCCGAQGPDDWDFNIYFNCSSESKSREKCGVPFSCCIPDPAQKVVNTQCGYDIRKKSKSQWDDQIFVKGCILALEAWLPRNIYIVAGVFIAISLLQIFGIFLARTLISDIEAVKAGNAF
ncbi:tetraspanin-14 isoform 1-T1 [Ara ararauna]